MYWINTTASQQSIKANLLNFYNSLRGTKESYQGLLTHL